jgi:hypothetical protein
VLGYNPDDNELVDFFLVYSGPDTFSEVFRFIEKDISYSLSNKEGRYYIDTMYSVLCLLVYKHLFAADRPDRDELNIFIDTFYDNGLYIQFQNLSRSEFKLWKTKPRVVNKPAPSTRLTSNIIIRPRNQSAAYADAPARRLNGIQAQLQRYQASQQTSSGVRYRADTQYQQQGFSRRLN